MIVYFLLVVVAVFLIAPLLVIPARARRALLANCRNDDGTISAFRSKVELKALFDLSGTITATCLVVALPLILMMGAIHSFVIPIPLAIESVNTDFRNESAWKANPKRGPFENVALKHERFVIANGGTKKNAHAMQRTLWQWLPAFFLLWIVFLAALSGWLFSWLRRAFYDYHKDLRTRSLLVGNRQYAMLSRLPNPTATDLPVK